MSATYFDSLPRPLDRVRFLIGDTDLNALYFSDAAITEALTRQTQDVDAAALELARGWRAALAMRPVQESADGVSVNYAARIPQLDGTIRTLDAQAGGTDTTAPRRSQSRSVEVAW